ncbi:MULTISPECIES: 30S ribosome-binding factor RbfA [Caloramator]|jgi:ribosome-binding factor A|uniref:Ribosome-binding factor A n=1 Tax=Caloramator australicus RC3 TaxID=857293 RepID=I7LGT3_9CLOT|nr:MULTISPECIES: 30S ribosome-binding factor RbfA [Caloramator]MDO6354081.1 30S ribosome-binding factor RbfA [Caloramator sp. CAR-1]WDU84030.1 30S ribosome-binding factor RbfA [Caloramator sp. Dgby_cultured_2]CCJ33535.1 Ribosome-binding factor A [Caloramator australicus RC3]
MAVERTSRLSEEIKRIVGDIIQNELKDPRIPMLTSITDVEVTKDLRYAKVYVSVFGSEDEKLKCLEGLKNAAGFIRKEVGRKIKARYTPEILFELDRSIEYGMHITKMLQEMKNNDSE